MAKHSRRQAAPQQQYQNQVYAQGSNVNPAVAYAQMPKKKRGKGGWIALGVIVVLIALAYLIGAWLFTFMFLPNSKIASLDVSMKTSDAVQQELNSSFNSFSINVTGSGLDFKVDAATAGVSADTSKIVKDALSSVDIWKWPLEVMTSHDYSKEISANLSEGNLGDVVQQQVDKVNEEKVDSVDAHLQWNESGSAFVVEQETYGTKIDAKAVEQLVTNAIVSMGTTVSVGSEQCIKPSILKTDSRWDAALKQANTYAKANFKIMMGDSEAATVNGSVIKDWLVVDDNLGVSLNSDAVNEWANGIAEGCNTVGTERTYTRPNGNKTITVSGGTYGWEADATGLSDEIVSAIQNGSTSPISVNVTQSANSLVPAGQADWGGRWIDIDLTEQHAYMYDGGNLVWETDVITGNPTVNEATPKGVWMVNAKRTNETLKGPTVNGTPEWENTVQYWMPFIGNSHGMHDASWRSVFGGSVYQTADWSHGCINLPIDKAAALYELCQIGDAVIVHD